jgi:ABC-type antimicrobial peptide transport system permease subunit
MISWRDSLALSRKRWQRKRIFGSLKYSAPLFLLTLLTIITLNVTYAMLDRVRAASENSEFPHPSHLRIAIPPKSESSLKPSQIKTLREHPAVLQIMTAQTWMMGFYADMGEVRFAPVPYICGYTKEFFDLYRTLPPGKTDPTCVPVLLGRDLMSLSWSPVQLRFIRNEKEEIHRWLGRTFTVYLNPWGAESVPSEFKAEQLDYVRYRKSIMDNRKKHLVELERINPDLARLQDALTVKLQVVGFVRDPTNSSMTCVIPEDIAVQIGELSALRRGKKPKDKNDDNLSNVNLIVAPGREQEVRTLATSLGLKVHDRNTDGIIAQLFNEIKDNPGTRLTLYVIMSLYSLAMMVIIYQLLSGQVKDSIREIGLLRCIGARRRDIMRIFIVMNLVRLARIYLSCLVAAYVLLFGFGYWFAEKLNVINPESLAKGNIPDYLIYRIDHFTPFWLIGPPWMAVMPLLFLVPIALGSAVVPIWHVMGVQPSEALRD